MKIRGIFVDVMSDNCGIKEVEITDELEDLYRLLGVDCIDIVTRKIGNRTYDIVCDDEALLKDNPVPSMYNRVHNSYEFRAMLFGNLFICKNAGPNLASLDDSDIPHIMKNTLRVKRKDKAIYQAIGNGDYPNYG